MKKANLSQEEMIMIQAKRLVVILVVLSGFLHLVEPASAQRNPENALFDVKLSYAGWSSGIEGGAIYGYDGGICPDWWPFRWPPRPGPRPGPRFDFRFADYHLSEKGLDRALPLELGLLLPLSSASRVTPYIGAGLGYYLLDGDSLNLDDELGGYGALGAEIRLGERWGLNIEGGYREVGGNLDLSGPVFKAGLGFNL